MILTAPAIVGAVELKVATLEAHVNRVLDMILRRERIEPAIPLCPDHSVEMRLRGKQGRPARFAVQTEEEYTLIYFCPVEGCDNSAEVKRAKTQVPVPGEPPARPPYSRG
jgi:hypothetical protein